MLNKFETKSKRVKGLSFHSQKPWILASLHNGSVHLFDYRAQALLDKFEEHEGPVRGVNFHETQPLFVSGGDDHKVKVWSYKTKKCMFTLTGHLDYVRTVEFHKELPWIISSSDDQTVRLWNWQRRSVIAILTGHSHYVMCACFHPEDTLIASASLDQTVRIWDFARLKEKSMQKSGSRPNEIFGGTEVEVKHIIEGHERGVNWVAFHPTMRIVASAADDKSVRLWRLSGNRHWELDKLAGHSNNVSCVLFHPRLEVLLSNSEDKTLRVWDLNRRVQISQTRRDTDRYWILAAHPNLNYFATGYDNGMTVFKLERERYASQRVGQHIFFVKSKNLYAYDLSTKDKSLLSAVNTVGKQPLMNQPKSLYINQFNNSAYDIILNFDGEHSCFVIYEFGKDLKNATCSLEKRGDNTLAATFISKDKICVLDMNRELAVCNLDGSNIKKVQLNKKGLTKVEMIYPAPLGRILVHADDTLFMYDLAARKVLAELSLPEGTIVKQVHWTSNFSHFVVITQTQLMMVSKNFELLNSQKESNKVKAGCFDEAADNAFVYSTSTHLKYMFASDKKTTGTFKSIDQPVYVSFFMKNQVFAIDRQGEMQAIEVNNTDYLFKVALQRNDLMQVKEILSQGSLCGNAIVSYLKEQGHSEIALFFEKDVNSRYNLALACGNLQVAFDAAKELNEKECFIKLAQTAMALGNYEITEKCYQLTRSFDKLNFFYAATGSLGKLQKMQAVASNIGDPVLRFNSATLTANVAEKVKVLAENGQVPLAFITARSHGLEEFAKTLETTLIESEEYDHERIFREADRLVRGKDGNQTRAKALLPCRPIFPADERGISQVSWPMINMRAKEAERAAAVFRQRKEDAAAAGEEMFFDANQYKSSNTAVANILADAPKAAAAASEAEAGLTTITEAGIGQVEEATLDMDGDAWGDDGDAIDLDLGTGDAMPGEDASDAIDGAAGDSDIFVPPSQGADPIQQALKKNPQSVGLHVAAGEFSKAMILLKKQLGVSNFEPLRQIFIDVHTLSKMKFKGVPHSSPTDYQLRFIDQPLVTVTLGTLQKLFTKGKQFASAAKFEQALAVFRRCLQTVPLLTVSSEQALDEVHMLTKKLVEYITAMRIELERRRVLAATPDEKVRITELSCYMTLCGMDNVHKYLAYKNAMQCNYKIQNYITAAHFARLVLDLEPTGIFASKPDVIAQHKKYYAGFQQAGTNAVKLNFNQNLNAELSEINGYLCLGSLQPIEDNRAQNTIKSPLDGSIYGKEYAGKLCPTSELCQLGDEVVGLNIKIEKPSG